MPKKIDWETIKQSYLAGDESMADLALRFGLSKRAIEKKASEEGWAALRKARTLCRGSLDTLSSAGKIASPKKPDSPQSHQRPRTPSLRRQHNTAHKAARTPRGNHLSTIYELEVLETAIATLSGAIEKAEVKSLEGAASSLAKLLELRRKFAPPTAAALAEQVLALGIDPKEFAQELKRLWEKT